MKNDLKSFFPETIYYCGCLHGCFNGRYSLQEICDRITNVDGQTIFIVRCNKKRDVVCSCIDHIPAKGFTYSIFPNKSTLVRLQMTKNCLACIKNYLRRKYNRYNHIKNTD